MEIDEGMQDKEDSCDDLRYNTPFVYIDPCS